MVRNDNRIAPTSPRDERAEDASVAASTPQRTRAKSFWPTLAACAIALCAIIAGGSYALGWSEGDEASDSSASDSLAYSVYLQDEGWTGDVELGGCVEGLQISLSSGADGSVSYCVKTVGGWSDWAADGETAGGDEGVAAIKVQLSGAAADAYDVWYRVWVDGYGWTGWTRNGAMAGSGSAGAVVEAVEVQLLAKGSTAPGDVLPAVITTAATSAAGGIDAEGADEEAAGSAVGESVASEVEAATSSDIASDSAAGSSDAADSGVAEAEAADDAVAEADDEVAAEADEPDAEDGASSSETTETFVEEENSDSESTESDDSAATITVTLSIDASRAEAYGYDVSMDAVTLTLAEGSTVYDALCALGVSVGGTSTYVSSIAGLAEFACGSGSGWMYSVDGEYPNKACGKYELSGGEVIVWVYTCDLGNDL